MIEVLKNFRVKNRAITGSFAVIISTALLGSIFLHYIMRANEGYSVYYVVLAACVYVGSATAGVLAVGRHFGKTIEKLTEAKHQADRESKSLLDGKTRLEAIINSISDGIMIVDKDYRIISTNRVMQNFIGKPFEQIHQQHCYEMCKGTKTRCNFCVADATFRDGKHMTTYCTRTMSDGKDERILEIHDFPLYGDNGEVEQIIEYVKDVTDAVKLQANLESSRRLAEIGEMAAKVAHEVRNPLNAIKGATHYLRPEIKDNEGNDYLDLIEEQVDRVNQVTTQLLNLSKPMEPVMHPGRIENVLDGSLRLTAQLIVDKNIRIEKCFSTGLPEIPLDEQHIGRAVVNLLLNSIDAMEHGGTLRIMAKQVADEDAANSAVIQVVVADDGCGIDAENMNEIFDPFFTTKTKGTGLGLTIVKKIVDHHQGKLKFESNRGSGTKVTLSLPVTPEKHVA